MRENTKRTLVIGLVVGLFSLAAPGAVALNGDAPAAVSGDTATSAAEASTDASANAGDRDAPVQRKVRFQTKEAVSFKQKIQIYNRTKDEAEQLYCREDRITGSHRKRMRCVTNETRQIEEDAARRFFASIGRGI